MVRTSISILFLLVALKITTQGSVNDESIEKLLKTLVKTNPNTVHYRPVTYSSDEELESHQRHDIHHDFYHGRSHNHVHDDNHDDKTNDPKLLNIQNLNLVFKHNALRNKGLKLPKIQRTETENEDIIEKILQDENERNCMESGRCGCSGNRCGEHYERSRKDKDSLEQLIDELQKELDLDENRHPELRCVGNRCERRDDNEQLTGDGICIGNKCDTSSRNEYKTEKDNRCEGDRCDGRSEERDELRCVGNNCYKDKHQNKDDDFVLNNNGKKYSISEDFDVIVLDMSDMNKLLNNLNIRDKFGSLGKKISDSSEIFLVNDIDLKMLFNKDFDKIKKKRIKSTKKNVNQQRDGNDTKKYSINRLIFDELDGNTPLLQIKHVNPNDLALYYDYIRQDFTKKSLNFVKNPKAYRKDVSFLTSLQKRQLHKLRDKYLQKQLNDTQVQQEIEQIIFGKFSNIKIIPHRENNNYIYVPSWIYEDVLSLKNDLDITNILRTKNLLPLTTKQREKMQRKLDIKNI